MIELNKRVLRLISVKRADRHLVLSVPRLQVAIGRAKAKKGDVYDKAAIVLSELVRGHAFASGVRRTAFVATMTFLAANGEHPGVVHNPNVLTGIREGFYTLDEIKDWLKGNAIREFIRK